MRRAAWCVGFLALIAIATPVAAQRPPACSPPSVSSRTELLDALRNLHETGAPDVHAARIASLGQPVTGWALDIAADSTQPPARRASALLVVRYARWKQAIPILVRLAEPLRGEWVVWSGALKALASYPYQELEPFWTDMVVFPRRVVREQALRGLALVGNERSMLAVRASTRHEDDAASRALVAEVEAKLRLPLAARDTAVFAWPPDSLGGRFTPSAAWLRAHGDCQRSE